MQHCEGFVPALFGSIRYHAGDPGCGASPTALPATTRTRARRSDACQAASARGRAPARAPPRRPLPHGRALRPVRRRLRGRAGSKPARHPAATETRAPSATAARAGVHGGGLRFLRTTGTSARTNTSRAIGGCVFAPVPCWSIAGTARVAVWAASPSHRPRPLRQPRFVLRADGTYRLPSTTSTSCGPEIPDEVGTYRTGRRRRSSSRPNVTNRRRGGPSAFGISAQVTSYRTVVHAARSGRRLHGTSTSRQLDISGSDSLNAVAVFKGRAA